MITEAIVLAGGLGTRLRSEVAELPKAMAPINGRPFLEYLFDYLQHYGIKAVYLSVGYKASAIEAHFGNRYRDLILHYVPEDEPLGTGGAILKALRATTTQTVLATNGDSIFACDLTAFGTFHAARASQLSLALKPMTNFDRYGTVTVNEHDRVTGFEEKQPRESGLISAGVYLINRDWLLAKPLPEKCSMERDVLEAYHTTDAMAGFQSTSYFLDIGIPEDFQKAQHEFADLEY